MTFAAVTDTSAVIALVRGGVFECLGAFFKPLYIGSGAEHECRKDSQADAVLNHTQSLTPSFPLVLSLIARTRRYDPGLSTEDIQGIEIALDRAIPLITQDDLQMLEAKKAGVLVLHTFDLLDGFKRRQIISSVAFVLAEMERQGESYPKAEKNRLLQKVREPFLP